MDLKEAKDETVAAKTTAGATLEAKVKSYKHLHSIAEYLTKKVSLEWPGTFFKESRWF